MSSQSTKESLLHVWLCSRAQVPGGGAARLQAAAGGRPPGRARAALLRDHPRRWAGLVGVYRVRKETCVRMYRGGCLMLKVLGLNRVRRLQSCSYSLLWCLFPLPLTHRTKNVHKGSCTPSAQATACLGASQVARQAPPASSWANESSMQPTNPLDTLHEPHSLSLNTECCSKKKCARSSAGRTAIRIPSQP